MQHGFNYIRQLANEHLRDARAKQKRDYDIRRSDTQFHVGDKVLVAEIKIRPAGQKLFPRHLGPYTVVQQSSLVNYVLRLDPELRTDVFHVDRLRRFYERDTSDQTTPEEADPNVDTHDETDDFSPRRLRSHHRPNDPFHALPLGSRGLVSLEGGICNEVWI